MTDYRIYVRNVYRELNGVRFNLGIYDNELNPGSRVEDSTSITVPYGQTGSYIAEKINESLIRWESEVSDFNAKRGFINLVFSGLAVAGSVNMSGSIIAFP